MNKKQNIFALDIGTRSVVGIILEEANQKEYLVRDLVVREHKERAMLDGQIHDVVAVSKVIREVKNILEEKHGPLRSVCVAAAGRSLKTEKAQVSIPINGKPMMTKEDILHLELSAIQEAQAIAAEKFPVEKSKYYYCVGYSVFQYRLDGEVIGSLIDQKGEEASVEIIATFLPRVVVESLISALTRANLEMDALTLEPIAAINVLIPASMRRLNVALVDIGAGTSDIALTSKGTIAAYGMVPLAGDEITEAISDYLLLDFPHAEQAKRELLTKSSLRITDILGYENECNTEDVIKGITPSIDRLADEIAKEILFLNNKSSPQAVMLVGGGSLTPGISEKIAEMLGLPANRVAIRGTDAIQQLTLSENIPESPEFVTPIGIAIASKQTPVHYVTAYVNEQPIRLFDIKQLTVGDCLLASGLKINSLHGKPGMASIISLNGQTITIPGEHGLRGKVLRNNVECQLDERIENGDWITAIKGADGNPAQIKIKDLLDDIPCKKVTINDREYTVRMRILKNGRDAAENEWAEDHDELEISFPETLEELFTSLNLQALLNELKTFRLVVNGKDTFIPSFSSKLSINGKEARASSSFKDGDQIQVVKRLLPTASNFAEVKKVDLYSQLTVFFNNEQITIFKPCADIWKKGNRLRETDVLVPGDAIEIKQRESEPFLFQDIFRHVEIEMPQNGQGKFLLLKNKERTSFNEEISEGDQLEIVWPFSARPQNMHY
ncbi:cell division protein FtsA [Heyndrickxia acidicola]|uniref:Cell division protein FtsA n=1 Tax=Heyndrickxia acidicola TaxID=209389 RepID=A0ABU6MET3_9BACI|nr:cell division protein FtsA [Heyndrickxia acidicola]MED1203168.1 cell division protein FtsA [Heyndrickxia acidicola]